MICRWSTAGQALSRIKCRDSSTRDICPALSLRRAHGIDDSVVAPVLQEILAGKTSVRDEPALYICERGACRPPVVGKASIQEALESL